MKSFITYFFYLILVLSELMLIVIGINKNVNNTADLDAYINETNVGGEQVKVLPSFKEYPVYSREIISDPFKAQVK